MQDENGSEWEADSAFRRRAQSEVVRQPAAAKWKLVAAFSNLRRSWESGGGGDERTSSRAPQSPPTSSVTPPVPVPPSPSASAAGAPTTPTPGTSTPTSPEPAKRRKRVSLFLRRRGRFREGNVAQSAYVGDAAAAIAAGTLASGASSGGAGAGEAGVHFRRAQSHFVKPVSYESTTPGSAAPYAGGYPGGEGGRYLRYAAEFDPEDFEKKRNALRKLRPAAIRLAPPPLPVPHAPTTAAANADSSPLPKRAASSGAVEAAGTSVKALAERFGGMNSAPVAATSTSSAIATSTGVGVDDDGADEREGEIFGEICLEDFADDGSEDFEFLDGQIVDVWPEAVRLDGQAISLAGEEEFAAFCKEVGLHQLLKPPEPSPQDWSTFDVGDDVNKQWREDARMHNEIMKDWNNHQDSTTNSAAEHFDAGNELRSIVQRRRRRPIS